jgi:chromosome segregation ATPase
MEMSEQTPRGMLEEWLGDDSVHSGCFCGAQPEVREAIRAVLAELASVTAAIVVAYDTVRQRTEQLRSAEVKRDDLKAKLAEEHAGRVQASQDWLAEQRRASEYAERLAEDRSTAPWDAWKRAEARVRELEAERGSLLEQLARKDAERGELRAEVERLRNWQMVREREIDTGMTRLEARAERAEAALREYREILTIPHNSSPEDLEDEVCCRCGEPYNTRPGCDASPECDPCAQEVLGLARAALRDPAPAEEGKP